MARTKRRFDLAQIVAIFAAIITIVLSSLGFSHMTPPSQADGVFWKGLWHLVEFAHNPLELLLICCTMLGIVTVLFVLRYHTRDSKEFQSLARTSGDSFATPSAFKVQTTKYLHTIYILAPAFVLVILTLIWAIRTIILASPAVLHARLVSYMNSGQEASNKLRSTPLPSLSVPDRDRARIAANGLRSFLDENRTNLSPDDQARGTLVASELFYCLGDFNLAESVFGDPRNFPAVWQNPIRGQITGCHAAQGRHKQAADEFRNGFGNPRHDLNMAINEYIEAEDLADALVQGKRYIQFFGDDPTIGVDERNTTIFVEVCGLLVHAMCELNPLNTDIEPVCERGLHAVENLYRVANVDSPFALRLDKACLEFTLAQALRAEREQKRDQAVKYYRKAAEDLEILVVHKNQDGLVPQLNAVLTSLVAADQASGNFEDAEAAKNKQESIMKRFPGIESGPSSK